MFLQSRASFPPHFLRIVVEVKASGPPCVLELWFGISKGMLPVRYFCLRTVVGSKQGYAPCEILLSSNCGLE